MKLDLYKSQWLDLVFEGRNKKYGAYLLRKENSKTSLRALIIGAASFGIAIASPMLIDMIPSGDDDATLDEKVVLVDMNKPKENTPPPPPPEKKPEPPKPKVDEVKFVEPKVVEAKKVTEEIKTVDELKDKNIAEKDQKGDKDAQVTIDAPTGNNEEVVKVVEEDNTVYNSAGIEVQPEFPGGYAGFAKFVQRNFRTPEVEEDVKGRIFVEFVVEKDGSLTDIHVLKDLGYGTKEEAIRMLKSAPRWTPGEQNGKKIRVKYSLPITIEIKAE
ncbi:energy transducer TonB [Flavobacterium sp.]|uniref:energy transducer TonB n=1 Tax=Flavobacterium sp. TaxID=239 RepID=UPI003D0ECCD8